MAEPENFTASCLVIFRGNGAYAIPWREFGNCLSNFFLTGDAVADARCTPAILDPAAGVDEVPIP